jgi:hypothetical protein
MAFATALTAAGIGLQAGSKIYAGRVAEAQAKSQESMAEYNAAVAEQNAKMVEQKTTFDQLRQLKRGRTIMGTLRVRQGASGARMDVGAPLMAADEQAIELELENLLIGYEGAIAAARYRSQAEMFGMEADIAGERGKHAKRAGYIGAGTSLLTGFGAMYGAGMLGKTTKSTGTRSGKTTPSGSTFSRKTTSGLAHRIGR